MRKFREPVLEKHWKEWRIGPLIVDSGEHGIYTVELVSNLQPFTPELLP